MRAWLRHAFAIPQPEAFAPTAAEAAWMSALVAEVTRRGLTLPVSVTLESIRPLGSLGAQTLWFAQPWMQVLTGTAGLSLLAKLLERPGAIEYLLAELSTAGSAAPEATPPTDTVNSVAEEARR